MDTKDYCNNPEFVIRVSKRILHYINALNLNRYSILECGCGEGAKLLNILKYSKSDVYWVGGIDISWSRIQYAKELFRVNSKRGDCHFYVADMFALPFMDNSIDIVYTMQGIYAMGGRERQLVRELLRIASRYLILVDPSYELGDEESRKRMVRLNYVKELKYVAEDLDCKVILYEPFGVDRNPQNPAAILLIEKNTGVYNNIDDVQLVDPINHTYLSMVKDVLYSDDSKISFPIIDGIPCLMRENAILTSKIKDF